MNNNYPKGWTYHDFAPLWKAEFFNPQQWAKLFVDSGAKYVVLTSKHHEGFTLWPSNYSWGWNSVDVGPHRDLVGELGAAVKSQGIKFGLYHSLFEWFNPLWNLDRGNNFKTSYFADRKTMPELYELVNAYKPEVIWSDGPHGASTEYYKSKEFLAWLYNESPVKDTVVVNDRWGTGSTGRHGDFFNVKDRYRPGKLVPHKWENCMTLDRHTWGFSRTSVLENYYTIDELVKEVVETVAFGGNILINVGPTADGRIVPIFEYLLRGLGSWLAINGEAIYDTVPWKYQKDNVTSDVYYTQSTTKSRVYVHFSTWPHDDELHLHSIPAQDNLKVALLNRLKPIDLKTSTGKEGELVIDLSTVDRFVSRDVAFVLTIEGL